MPQADDNDDYTVDREGGKEWTDPSNLLGRLAEGYEWMGSATRRRRTRMDKIFYKKKFGDPPTGVIPLGPDKKWKVKGIEGKGFKDFHKRIMLNKEHEQVSAVMPAAMPAAMPGKGQNSSELNQALKVQGRAEGIGTVAKVVNESALQASERTAASESGGATVVNAPSNSTQINNESTQMMIAAPKAIVRGDSNLEGTSLRPA